MPYKENLKKAENLKKQLDSFRPLSAEIENRIMQKFRLDWNYHSSNIEGNELTYGETKALILFNTTASSKPLKDHLEVKGHNEAILYIEEFVKNKRQLSEKFIRELHQIVLKEPYEVDAETPDGKPTKKKIQIGQYKTSPNHVKTRTGEMFYFASPEETPAKMNDLMDWYRENRDKVNPVLLATEFHYRFIRIHPFDDGNGRIARLLMNFILIQNGYPPAVVKTEDKSNYFRALEQADADQIEFFFNYICEQVIHSLEIMIKGAKGEDIDDEDDLDKKLALFKKQIENEGDENEIKIRLTVGVVRNILEKWMVKLVNELIEITAKFNEFYDRPNHYFRVFYHGNAQNIELGEKTELNLSLDEVFKNDFLADEIAEAQIIFSTNFGIYKMGGLDSFGCNYRVEVKFDMYNYEMFIDKFQEKGAKKQVESFAKKLLHKSLTPDEIKTLKKQWSDTLYQHLEYHSQNINKK